MRLINSKAIRSFRIPLSCALAALFAGVAAGAGSPDEPRLVTFGQAAPMGFKNDTGVQGNKLFFDFKNVPLEEAAAFVARRAALTGVALEAGIDQRAVTCAQYGASADMALRRIAQSAGCTAVRIDVNTYRIVRQKTVTINYMEVDIRTVIQEISKLADASVILHDEVTGKVNLKLDNVPWRDALDTVVHTAGDFVVVEEQGGILRIVPVKSLFTQRRTQIFQLSYLQPPDSYDPMIDTPYAERTAKFGRRRQTFSAYGTQFETRGGGQVKTETKEAQAQKDVLKRLKKISGTTFTLFNALLSVISPVGRFEYDGYGNSIIATDIPSKLDAIQDIISLLDIEPIQVFMDAKFVGTTNADLLDFGVNYVGSAADKGFTITHGGGSMATIWPFNRGSGGIEEIFGLAKDGPPAVRFVGGVPSPTGADALFQDNRYVFGVLDFSQFTTLLSILKEDQKTSIVQAPKIMTLDNHDATIFVGRTVRYAETVSQTSAGGGVVLSVQEATNSPVETGFQLFVTPHVIKGTDNVILSIIPQEQTLTGTTSPIPGFNQFGTQPNVIQLPQVDTRTLVTKVMLRSGQTLVLGGLVDERSSETVRKIPFLGDIPVLGYLFKFKTQKKERNNLMLFITVMVVRSADDAERIFTVHRGYDGGFVSATERMELTGEETKPAGGAPANAPLKK